MLIRTQNLTKIYKLGKVAVVALKDISLEVKKGEVLSIMGPSGSGKSTLLNLLGCLDTPTSGKYFLQGVEITQKANLAHIRRERVGFIFQTFNLLPRINALQNVELPMIYKGLPIAHRRKRALELLETVGLSKRSNHKPNELSGGERQRVAIARALANEPLLILADEPTGNLDSKSGEEILKIITDLNKKGTTIILVTHEEYIAKKTERRIRLLDGRIVS